MLGTILSSALGFGTSFVPKLLDTYQDSKDKKHELAVMEKQLIREEKMADKKAEAMVMQGEIQRDTQLLVHDAKIGEGASKWVTNMRSSVRPIITYLFFIMFFMAEGVTAYVLLNSGADIETIKDALWSEDTQAIFAAVISFWFGSRAIKK